MRSKLVVLCLGVAALAQAQYFGKNKVRYDTFTWKEFSTPHFRISFYDRVEPQLGKVASFAESAYDELARKLNFQIPEPIPIIAYATHAEFEQTNVIVEGIPEGVGAFAVPARNRMVLPVDLPDAELAKLIAHELVHIFQYEILFQGKLGKALTTSIPQWFMEGMASYLAQDEDSRARAVMRDATLADRVPSVADNVSGYFAYRFGHMVFAFVEAEWGVEGLRDFVFETRNTLTGSVDKAIKRAFDLDVEEFDARFRAWLRKQYQGVAADRGDPREFGPAFRVEEGVRSVEASPAVSPSGELVAAFTIYKEDVDVALFSVPKRTLFRNLTKGFTTAYEYLIAQLFTVGPDRGRDLAFSPDGDTVAVFARRERGRVLLLLDVVSGGVRKEYPIPQDQAMEPAFSPDGKYVAFHAFAQGQADIFLLDLASGAISNLTQDEAYDAAPVFSPDGKFLVYSSQSGEHAKLFQVELANPQKRIQLTFGPGDDEGASFSRDGKVLYFASDRDGGIFDIYRLDLATRALRRLTKVIGAALNPAPVVTKEGEKVVYQAYTKGRWQLYLTDPGQGQEVGEEKEPTEVAQREAFQPAVTVAVNPEKISTVKKRKLFADNVQAAVQYTQDGTLISQAFLSFADHYGDRRVNVLLESVSGYSNFQAAFLNLEKRFQWGVTVFDDRSYFVAADSFTGREVRLKRLWRETGGAVFFQYPFSLYLRAEGAAGYIYRDVDYPVLFGNRLFFIPITDQIPFLQAGLTGDTTGWNSYGPHWGRRWQLLLVQAFDGKGGGTLSRELRLDARQYVPLSRRNELAFRLFLAGADGNRPSLFYFGGVDTLRGFDYRSVVGNQVGYFNAEWRFPLIDHLVLPWLHLRDFRGRFFLDVAAARIDVPGFTQPFRFLKNGRLQDGLSSYGFGFSVELFGLPVHWDFAKRWNFKQTLDRGYNTSFWIGFRF
jgi:Tol biopolymer transport system component